MANYHPSPDLLIQYASGQLDDALGLMIACHVETCDECKQFVAGTQALAGSAIASIEEAPVSDGLFDKVMSSLENNSREEERSEQQAKIDIPRPLQRFLPEGFSSIKWSGLTSIKSFDLPFSNSNLKAQLLKIPAGYKIPQHTHLGHEYTFVMKGSFYDEEGCYQEEDFVVADGDTKHAPRVTDDGECICFAVLDAPLHMTGRLGKLLNLFLPKT